MFSVASKLGRAAAMDYALIFVIGLTMVAFAIPSAVSVTLTEPGRINMPFEVMYP